jgi:hypothetical protein
MVLNTVKILPSLEINQLGFLSSFETATTNEIDLIDQSGDGKVSRISIVSVAFISVGYTVGID